MQNAPRLRYPEIDLLRSLAILGMVVYHTGYDLYAFYGWDINLFDGPWRLLQKSVAILFLVLVGVSFRISWERTPGVFLHKYRKYGKRGLLLLLCGLLITTVTYFIEPHTYVRFGILHVIGVSVLLLPFFSPLKEGNTLMGIVCLIIGSALPHLSTETSLFLPLGLMPPGFSSVDYYPLLPWFGLILIGDAIGHLLYIRLKRTPLKPKTYHLQILSWPGRHSLAIYLLHQPMLLIILGLLFGFPQI